MTTAHAMTPINLQALVLFSLVPILLMPTATTARTLANQTDSKTNQLLDSTPLPAASNPNPTDGDKLHPGFAGPGDHLDPPEGHGDTGDNSSHHGGEGGHGIVVAGWNWEYVKKPFIITLFLVVAGILKLLFHHAGPLPNLIPESCVLIILGTIVGALLYAGKSAVFPELEPSFFFLVLLPPIFKADRSSFTISSDLFFLFLLPPVVLESAYSLYDRVFFDNLGTILLYAVVGTIFNCFLIGPALYGLAVGGAMGALNISFIQCLVFSSLIVAVDPVAVLAIFQEIGVNNVLYFLVFGESLLNDAVTVVLYNMMKAFNRMDNVPASQVFLGIASFFTISLLGMLIGIVYGVLTAFITKYTEKVRVVEPLTVFTLAYASYLTADMFEFSGIISIFACGLVQAHFAFHNVSHKSSTTIKYFAKIISTTSDCIIFLFLGLALVNDNHVWHTGFVLWTLVLCLLFRFAVVYFLTFLANKMKRIRKIDFEEQFIMAYGGLRGAVAFSLVAMLDRNHVEHKAMFETTTLVVVLFTVFIQGMTIKPLVRLLRIRKEGQKMVSLYDEINNHVTDHVMAGLEEIIGYSGRNTLRETLDYYDDHYFKRFLQRSPMTKDEHIMELYKEIAIQDHYDSLANAVDMERYSSQMVLYHCENGKEKDDNTFVGMAQTHADLAERAIDAHIRKRSLRSRGQWPSPRDRAMTAPNRMLSDPGPELATDFESVPMLDDTEVCRIPAVGHHSRSATVTSEPSVDSMTAKDLRKLMVKPASAVHQRHDKNLLQEDDNDLIHLLQEKQKRTTRYLRSLSVSTPPPYSPPGSPRNAPRMRQVRMRARAMTEGLHTSDDDRPNPRHTYAGYRPRTMTSDASPRHSWGSGHPAPLSPLVLQAKDLEAPTGRPSSGVFDPDVNPLETIKEQEAKDNGKGGNGDSGSDNSSENNVLMRRALLSRQDKVGDLSPPVKRPGMDVPDTAPISFAPDDGKQAQEQEETRL